MPRPQLRRDPAAETATSWLELFYDLVFVFAITQISHGLLADLSWQGAGRMAVVLLVVWWAWNYTTWVTNELDPETTAVRGLMVALMLAGLLMAVAIPEAFGAHAGLFVGAYLTIQIGRHVFLTFVAAERGTLERNRALHILVWFLAAGVFWVAGAFADGPARTALWLVALAIDYSAPLALFRVPGLRPVDASAWAVRTGHFAERFGLFVLIALGESIVITGSTTSHLDLDTRRIVALSAVFLTTAAMWWLYFAYVQRIVERHLELAEDRTTLARDAYTYLHVVLVAGIIVAAAGDEIVLARPGVEPATAELLTIVGGPAIYLFAHAVFRLRVAGTLGVRRLAGAAGCAVVGLLASGADALVVALLVVVVLVAVIAAEEIAGARRRARGEPGPLERLATS